MVVKVLAVYCLFYFDICGSMHHHLINETTNVMQLGAIVFIIPWKALHVSGACYTHRQEGIKTVHAGIGTIAL
jgi:hypothetical protein